MGKVQPERGVGVHHVAGALVVVADAAPGRGQQFQQAVVPGTGGLGADLGGDGRNGVLVALLGRHGAQGGSRDDREFPGCGTACGRLHRSRAILTAARPRWASPGR